MSQKQDLLKEFSINYWKYQKEYFKAEHRQDKNYLCGSLHVMKYVLTKLESNIF